MTMRGRNPLRIGIDLGGTKIEAALVTAAGDVVWRERCPTPRQDYRGTIEAIAGLVARAEQAAGRRCTVGLGTPGSVSPATGLMRNCNSTVLNGQPLREDLQARLGRAVRLANDANCLAVSEAVDGAAVGYALVFGVILGTGVGGGIALQGRPWPGANGIAGEWGHDPLPWPDDSELPGPTCWCGKRGCLETWLSGPALGAAHESAGGGSRSAEQIARAALQGDALAGEVMARWYHRLARGLAAVINLLDPQVIVVGGGLSRIDGLYQAVPRLWRGYVFADAVTTRLVPAAHGDASGVRGAAWLWNDTA